MSVVTSPSVRSLENVTASWCFISTLWTTSNLKLNSRSRQRSTLLDPSERLRIDLRKASLVLFLNSVPSGSGRRSSTAHTMARKFILVVLYSRSALVRERDQYQIGFEFLPGTSWRNTHGTLCCRYLYLEAIAPYRTGTTIKGEN